MKLLIVDDNEQNRYMLQVLLEGYGYQVTSARDGAEALEVARRDPPDMIISDILMPVMDGFALCREWKKDEGLKAIPFVFYTATYTDPKDEKFALSLGAERFIVKPQEPDVFAEMVREVFENYKTDRLGALREPAEEEAVFFREYNEVLIRKLEDKLVQLEEANRVLEREIAERKQAEEALQRYVERLRTQHAIDGAILAAWSTEDTARAALRHIRHLIPCQRASVTAIDVDVGEAIVLALSGDAETPTKAGMHVPLESMGVIADLQDGTVRVVGDIAALSRLSTMEQDLRAAGVRSYVNVPLIAHGVLVGTLNLGATETDAFTSEHVDIATELANQLAIAVRQACLFEQVQRYAEELEQQVAARTAQLTRRTTQLQVAAEVARDATLAHDLDELLNRSVNLVRDRFGFYHAGIFLTDERGEYAVLRSATGEAGRQMLERGHRLRTGGVDIVGHVCASGGPRIAFDTGADAVCFDNPFLPDTRSEMALPMRVGGNIIGALDVQSTKEAAFDDEDVRILQVLADQLAVAIERTRLFERVQATLEERLRTIISNVPVILFALDREGVFTLSEGRGLGALGLELGEHVGMSIFDAYRDFPDVLGNARRALAGEVVNSVLEMAEVALEAWWSPVRGESGEVTGVIGVAIDVTERERLEEQIQRQERLAAVGQLAGGIAHDFNNFLMIIMLYAQMLQRIENIPPDAVPLAETICSESQRAAQLVQQILDFSRRSAMETQPVDLVSFVEEAIGILQKALPENVQLLTDVGGGKYIVNADPTRIQQVVMNLVLNARDAMPEGGDLRIALSEVTVRAGEEPPLREMPPGEWVCLSVADTGTGMTDEVLSHLFEPFFTTKGPKGTGLGLAQVYGIVHQHGGHIDVDTKLGQGTTFYIYLPTYRAEEEGVPSPEERLGTVEGQGETILFVEDEEQVREAGRRVLELLGYRVLTASGGREALRVYQAAERIDLVLTDIVMPEMGGKALIQELQRMNPRVKILALTGYTMHEDLQVLRREGFVDTIYKPLDVGTLEEAIRQMLKGV
jgi:PAS domain S-box-containing protein